MPAYQQFTTTRTTEPDLPTLAAQLRALDATAGIQQLPGISPQTYIIKKATAWTTPQRTAAQNAIDTAPASSPQLTAQNDVDQWTLSQQAFSLVVLDEFNALRTEINTLRAAVSPPLTPPIPPRTGPQMRTATRNKAGTL